MTESNTSVVHYWGGNPKLRTSRFDWHHAILDGCHKKGWQAAIVLSSAPQNEEIKKALMESNIECLYVNRPRHQFDFKCIIDSYRLFKHVRCTIAHFHCVHTSPIIGAALAGVPIRIWSNHSSDYRDDGRSPSWMHRLGVSTRVTCALAHKILPVSQSLLNELLGYGASEKKMSVAPIPIDLRRYTVRKEAGVSIRNSLGIAINELIVCTVGQAIYRKGWDILIRAFAIASKQIPDMHLLLVGAMAKTPNVEIDDYQKNLLHLADELGIKDRIHFLGVRHDVADILSASDIFAFSSRAEGLPLALVEAMAAGLPCIASSVSGIPEVIQNDKNGLLIASEDVDAFAAELTRLATDHVLRSQLSEHALLSLDVFSLDYQTKNILKIYDELLAKRFPIHKKDLEI
jgi:glycosyltransferase involved in cell wall biosynthesis